MSELQKFKNWIKGYNGLPGKVTVDYATEKEGAGIKPMGPQEIERRSSITGKTVVKNRLNFALNCTMKRPADAKEFGENNAEWLLGLQSWIQEQSVLGLAPVFGNCKTDQETIQAENGELFGLTQTDMGLYTVQVGITYHKEFGG